MIDINRYEVVILDCDGVIFDSNMLKVEAFRKALNKYDKNIVKMFCHHLKNNFGTSRHDLIRLFIVDFLRTTFNKRLSKEILEAYGNHCEELYENAKYTKSLVEFFDHHRGKIFYIASGGDEFELRKVLSKKKINQFFYGIYGSPTKKEIIIKNLVKKCKNKNIVMIGDAKADWAASSINNIDFIYMRQYSLVSSSMTKLSKRHNFKIIENLGDLING